MPMNMSMMNFEMQADTIASMKYFQYRIIAAGMFHWNNLPAGLDSDKMELMLIDRGTVAFFNTEEGYYVLPYTSDGMIDVYGNLLSIQAVPYNGYQLKQLDTVPRILFDNSARQTFNSYLRAFAERLAYIQKSIAIVERNSRLPAIVKVNETNKESFARLESKVEEGYPIIFVDESMDINAIQILPTGFSTAAFTALWNDYNKVEGEIYTMLGTMFNVEQNKTAGVGAAETIVNYSQTFALANSRLKQRQRWCEKLNAEFGFDIWCEKVNDYQDIVREMLGGHHDGTTNLIGDETEETTP